MRRWIVLGVLLAGCGQGCPVIDGNELWIHGPAASLTGPDLPGSCAGTDPALFDRAFVFDVGEVCDADRCSLNGTHWRGDFISRGFITINATTHANRAVLYGAATHQCTASSADAFSVCAEDISLDCTVRPGSRTQSTIEAPLRVEIHVAPPPHDSSHYRPDELVHWVGTASVTADLCSVEYADVYMRQLVL